MGNISVFLSLYSIYTCYNNQDSEQFNLMHSKGCFFMPFNSKIPCKHPLCPELIEAGKKFCPHHKQPTSEYEKTRNSINSKIYNTTWRKLRRVKLNSNPLYELCLAKGKVVQAEEVDHVKPVNQYPELRLVYNNLQNLCVTCHSKKTREENKNNKILNSMG